MKTFLKRLFQKEKQADLAKNNTCLMRASVHTIYDYLDDDVLYNAVAALIKEQGYVLIPYIEKAALEEAMKRFAKSENNIDADFELAYCTALVFRTESNDLYRI